MKYIYQFFLGQELCRGSYVVDISLTLGTHRDVADLAADSLFQIFHVIACFLGQVFPLAGCGDIAVPAGQVLGIPD